jgi:glucan phosphoethanolaminetransferase (alkaline phosphatase superfamily)
MTSSNLFYIISVTVTLSLLFFLLADFYYRLTGKNIDGLLIEPGTAEEKRLRRLSSTFWIATTMLLFVASIINLIPQINEYIKDDDSGFMIGVIIVLIVFCIGVLIFARSVGRALINEKSNGTKKK